MLDQGEIDTECDLSALVSAWLFATDAVTLAAIQSSGGRQPIAELCQSLVDFARARRLGHQAVFTCQAACECLGVGREFRHPAFQPWSRSGFVRGGQKRFQPIAVKTFADPVEIRHVFRSGSLRAFLQQDGNPFAGPRDNGYPGFDALIEMARKSRSSRAIAAARAFAG